MMKTILDRLRPRYGCETGAQPQRGKGFVPVVAFLLLLASVAPVEAQDWLTRRAADAVKRTRVGQDINRTALEAQMLAATSIDLEERGLETISVGALSFKVGAVDVRNGVGVRVRAYLYNPGTATETVPAPAPDLFVLVDPRGRRLDFVDLEVEGLPEEASEITVPALERVDIILLFTGPPREATTATLKVGELGMISGIPVHTGATPEKQETENAQPNVWRP